MHRGADGKPTQIGWVMEAAIDAETVACKFRYGTTDAAEDWWKIASDPKGKGHAFSIGFIPIKWVYGSVSALVVEFPQLVAVLAAAGLEGDDRLRVYTKIELLEISAVGVPSNRECLQILAAKMAGEAGDKAADELVDRLAAAVVEKLSVPARHVEAVLDATEGPDLATRIKEHFDASVAIICDKLAEITEQMTLSLDDFELDSEATDAPATDEGETESGDGNEGAKESSEAATRLAAAMRE